MGTWSTQAPTLPSGVTWGGDQSKECNNQSIGAKFVCSIVRLDRNNVCCRCVLYTKSLSPASQTQNVRYITGDGGRSDSFSVTFNTEDVYTYKDTRYYTVAAAPGSVIRILFNIFSNLETGYANMTAPDYLLPEMYVKVNGTVKQVAEAYVKVNGQIKALESLKTNGG